MVLQCDRVIIHSYVAFEHQSHYLNPIIIHEILHFSLVKASHH